MLPQLHYTTINPQYLVSDDLAIEVFLRQMLGIPAGDTVSLSTIPDPPNGAKPSQPLKHLICLAIFQSPHKRLSLQGIYSALQENFTWFRNEEDVRLQVGRLLPLTSS